MVKHGGDVEIQVSLDIGRMGHGWGMGHDLP